MLGKIEDKRKRRQRRVRWLDDITNSIYMKVKVAQSCPAFCNPKDYAVHRILQARILEWVAFPFSRGSSHPRDRTRRSNKGLLYCRWILYQLSTRESPMDMSSSKPWEILKDKEAWHAAVHGVAMRNKQDLATEKQLQPNKYPFNMFSVCYYFVY